MAEKRDARYDVIKGLAIIIVCIEHIIQADTTDYMLTGIHSILFAVQMPIFMIVSGYFYGGKEEKSACEAARNILRKAISYLIPFFSHELIFRPVFLRQNGIDKIKTIVPNSMDSGLWFLWVLFVLGTELTIAIYFTKKSSGVRKTICATAIFGVFQIATLLAGLFVGMKFLAIKQILFYSLYFIFGYVYNRHLEPYLSKNIAIRDSVLLICIIVGFGLSINHSMISLGEGICDIVIRFTAGICLSIGLVEFAKRYYKQLRKVKLDIIGKFTLEIYYIHGVAFSLLQTTSQVTLYSSDGIVKIICSLFITILYTTMLIAIIKCSKVADLVFFGKLPRKKENILKTHMD